MAARSAAERSESHAPTFQSRTSPRLRGRPLCDARRGGRFAARDPGCRGSLSRLPPLSLQDGIRPRLSGHGATARTTDVGARATSRGRSRGSQSRSPPNHPRPDPAAHRPARRRAETRQALSHTHASPSGRAPHGARTHDALARFCSALGCPFKKSLPHLSDDELAFRVDLAWETILGGLARMPELAPRDLEQHVTGLIDYLTGALEAPQTVRTCIPDPISLQELRQ